MKLSIEAPSTKTIKDPFRAIYLPRSSFTLITPKCDLRPTTETNPMNAGINSMIFRGQLASFISDCELKAKPEIFIGSEGSVRTSVMLEPYRLTSAIAVALPMHMVPYYGALLEENGLLNVAFNILSSWHEVDKLKERGFAARLRKKILTVAEDLYNRARLSRYDRLRDFSVEEIALMLEPLTIGLIRFHEELCLWRRAVKTPGEALIFRTWADKFDLLPVKVFVPRMVNDSLLVLEYQPPMVRPAPVLEY